MKWETDFSKLPKFDGKRFAGKNYICTTSDNQVVVMTWQKTEVRGKTLYRWELCNRISPWEVIAFMDFPEAYEPLK